jgi:hypothetical protein
LQPKLDTMRHVIVEIGWIEQALEEAAHDLNSKASKKLELRKAARRARARVGLLCARSGLMRHNKRRAGL